MKIPDYFVDRKLLKSTVNSQLYLVLRSKFLLSFILIAILPSAILGFIIYQNSNEVFKNNAISITKQNSELVTLSANQYLSEIKLFINQLLMDDRFIDYCNVQSETLNESDNIKNVKTVDAALSSSFQSEKPSLVDIYILKNNKTIPFISKQNYSLSSPDKFYSEKLKEAQNQTGSNPLTGCELRFFNYGYFETVFSVVYAIRDAKTGQISKVIVFDFNYDSFAKIINQIKIDNYTNSKTYIVDQNNSIIYCDNKALLASKFEFLLQKNSYFNLNNSFLDLENEQIFQYDIKFANQAWKAVYFIPKSDIYQGIYHAKTLVIVILSLIFSIILFSFFVSSMLLKPLNNLSSILSADKNLNYSPPPEHETKNAENVPSNSSSIGGLIQQVYRSQLEHKDAQLRALQNQINPHFLYNTLESIRGAALYYGIDSIAEMSRRLSLFFRYSISENVLVTLKDELLNLENYISIQNFRHDDKFEFSFDISEKILNFKILKLTLQPLVENSIKHGLETKLGKGRIKIKVIDFDKVFRIELLDDGLGIPSEKLKELNWKLSEESAKREYMNSQYSLQSSLGTGIGIQNVNSRILLYFGNQYGIRYKEVQEGTCVEITLPVIL